MKQSGHTEVSFTSETNVKSSNRDMNKPKRFSGLPGLVVVGVAGQQM